MRNSKERKFPKLKKGNLDNSKNIKENLIYNI